MLFMLETSDILCNIRHVLFFLLCPLVDTCNSGGFEGDTVIIGSTCLKCGELISFTYK